MNLAMKALPSFSELNTFLSISDNILSTIPIGKIKCFNTNYDYNVKYIYFTKK